MYNSFKNELTITWMANSVMRRISFTFTSRRIFCASVSAKYAAGWRTWRHPRYEVIHCRIFCRAWNSNLDSPTRFIRHELAAKNKIKAKIKSTRNNVQSCSPSQNKRPRCKNCAEILAQLLHFCLLPDFQSYYARGYFLLRHRPWRKSITDVIVCW